MDDGSASVGDRGSQATWRGVDQETRMTEGDRLFGDMSRPEHAYALGVVAVAGRVRAGVLEIRLRGTGEPLRSMMEAREPGDIPALHELKRRRVRIFAPLGAVAATYLGAAPGDRIKMKFPHMRSELVEAFVRGIFDATGSISSPRSDRLEVRLNHPGPRLVDSLVEFLGVRPAKQGKRTLRWQGSDALDLLGRLYDGSPKPAREKHVRRFLRWAHRVPQWSCDPEMPHDAPWTIAWSAIHPDAQAPFKERVSDSGYDVTLLHEKKRFGNTILYGTGLILEPPYGWYLDVVPRSSIIKTGYLLANNVGIIDRGYRGELMVPLVKIDPDAPDLPLPARVVQLVPRPIAHFALEQRDELGDTHRGAGGFGSTG